MRLDILTLFPEMFAPLSHSMIGRARISGAVEIHLWDIRRFSGDKHGTVDDTPYGGGAGMVMKPEPVFEAVDFVRSFGPPVDETVILSPQGSVFTQEVAGSLAKKQRLLLICGHYEGFDERIRSLATLELSIGDYVLTGGELPAMVVADACIRLIPGVLAEGSAEEDSFANQLLEYPQYTRPVEYRGMRVPEILLSGHHRKIELWRRRESLLRTRVRRPDLWEKLEIGEDDQKLIDKPVE